MAGKKTFRVTVVYPLTFDVEGVTDAEEAEYKALDMAAERLFDFDSVEPIVHICDEIT